MNKEQLLHPNLPLIPEMKNLIKKRTHIAMSSAIAGGIGALSLFGGIIDMKMSDANAESLASQLPPKLPEAQVEQISKEQLDFNTAIDHALATNGDLTAVVEKMGGREKLSKDFGLLQQDQERTKTLNNALHTSIIRQRLETAVGSIAMILSGIVGLFNYLNTLKRIYNDVGKQESSNLALPNSNSAS